MDNLIVLLRSKYEDVFTDFKDRYTHRPFDSRISNQEKFLHANGTIINLLSHSDIMGVPRDYKPLFNMSIMLTTPRDKEIKEHKESIDEVVREIVQYSDRTNTLLGFPYVFPLERGVYGYKPTDRPISSSEVDELNRFTKPSIETVPEYSEPLHKAILQLCAVN